MGLTRTCALGSGLSTGTGPETFLASPLICISTLFSWIVFSNKKYMVFKAKKIYVSNKKQNLHVFISFYGVIKVKLCNFAAYLISLTKKIIDC
jgi:hypothetical protein